MTDKKQLIMLKRKCPNCKNSIGLKGIMIPILATGKNKITCATCDVSFQNYNNYFFLKIMAFPIIMVIGKLPSLLNVEFSLIENILFIVLIVFILLIFIYSFIPLKVSKD